MGYDVRVNDPYKGVELVRAYSNPARGRMSLQLEINKRLYMDEATRTRTPASSRCSGSCDARRRRPRLRRERARRGDAAMSAPAAK